MATKTKGSTSTKTTKKKAPKKATNTISSSGSISRNNSVRRLPQPKYKSFKISKRIKHQRAKLPPAWRLFWRSLKNLVNHWKIFLGILIIYIVLTLTLVKGFGVSSNLVQIKESLQGLSGGSGGASTGLNLFGYLLGTSGASSDVAGAYQSMLLIVTSLAIIWGLRQTQAKVKIRIRDTFYKGLFPLAPFILVLLVIGLQTVPLLGANMLYSLVFGNGLAVTLLESILWASLIFLLSLLTIYMVTSSLFALYIVTLPDVEPLQALRSARDLVRFRRWAVMRKLLFLPLVLIILGVILVVPMILYLTAIAEWVYFILSMLTLIIVHSYIYTVYRELLV